MTEQSNGTRYHIQVDGYPVLLGEQRHGNGGHPLSFQTEGAATIAAMGLMDALTVDGRGRDRVRVVVRHPEEEARRMIDDRSDAMVQRMERLG